MQLLSVYGPQRATHPRTVADESHHQAVDPMSEHLPDSNQHQGRSASLRDDLRPPLTPARHPTEAPLIESVALLARPTCDRVSNELSNYRLPLGHPTAPIHGPIRAQTMATHPPGSTFGTKRLQNQILSPRFKVVYP